MPDQHAPRCAQLIATKDEVLADWLAQVRRQIPHACSMPLSMLVDTLPAFYEHLVMGLLGEAADHATIASEHGAQRARVTRFNAGSIVYEFQLLRAAATEAWRRAGIALALEETARLDDAIDVALRSALTGFSTSQVQLREQFFSALTHDLRTPLAAATAAVSLMHNANDLARVRRMAEIAMRQHAMLASMVGELLDMMVFNAGTETLDVTHTELYELAAGVVDSIVLSSNRDIRLSGAPIRGQWHAAAIRRAIENLLNNAVKYSDKDTPVDISVGAVNGYAVVTVANQGPAIPEDQREAIFQLFRRSRADIGRGIAGWGVGLPYVRTVAEQHGGSVTVESDTSRTAFMLALPLDRI